MRPISRRLFRISCAGLAALLALASMIHTGTDNGSDVQAAHKKSAANAGKPNIVVVIVDDLGYADVSTYGVKRIPTPHIDALAQGGVLFTHGYVVASLCSPLRAGLITGRYPQRFGFEYLNTGPNIRDSEKDLGLAVGEVTLATALGELGYSTGAIGKWHLGAHDDFYPTNRGFDEFFGFLSGATSYIDTTLADVHTDRVAGETPRARTRDSRIIRGANREVVNNEDKYLTDELAREAGDFIRRNAGKPFFLYVAFNAPHLPFQVTKKYYDRFPEIADNKMRIYAAMVSALDDGIGGITGALKEAGVEDNTLVVFLSDNGCEIFAGICACQPLRGTKFTEFEGGVRVPFLMRWPSRLKSGTVYKEPISSLDIFPTAIAAAGGKLMTDRVYDGVDLMPYLKGHRKSPHPELYWMRRPHVAVSDGEWKLWYSETGQFHYLFNLKDDPNETNNLYKQEPEKVAELKAKLDDWRAQMTAPAWPSSRSMTAEVCGAQMEFPF
jgi:arylsulfatase A-like enzyme